MKIAITNSVASLLSEQMRLALSGHDVVIVEEPVDPTLEAFKQCIKEQKCLKPHSTSCGSSKPFYEPFISKKRKRW